MRQEIGLEADGAPAVRPFRSSEGQLVFRYLTIRSGGMAVWVPVDDTVLRDARVPQTGGDVDLNVQLRAVALSLARSVAAGDAARLERVDDLEQQVEALGVQVEASERELREALARVEALEAEKRELVEAAEQRARAKKASEAARAKRTAAAA